MKIRLEKPAVNISKLKGGKNDKVRRGTLHEKFRLDLYFVCRKHRMEFKITAYAICRQEDLIKILLHIYNVQQTELISGFLLTFVTHKS